MGFCTACGAGLGQDQRFCAQCGAPRASAPSGQQPSGAQPAQGQAPRAGEPATSPLTAVPAGQPGQAAAAPGPPTSPPPAPSPPDPGPWRWVAVLSVLVLVGVAGTAVGWWLSGDDAATPVGQVESGTGGEDRSTGDEGGGDEDTAGPSGESGTVALPEAPPDWDRDRVAVADVQVPGQSADSQDNAGNPVTYDAGNMTDGRADTTWRMDGDGAGEELTVVLGGPTQVTHVGLINGYAKTDASGDRDDRYRQNRRLTSVTWTLDDGTTVTQSLQETRALQYVAVPDTAATSSVRLTLNGTTAPGSKNGRVYDHTAVSELAVFGR